MMVQANYPTHSVHIAMTKSQCFDESKQSSSAMHDLDGVSDQDIMFGHMRDETKDAMHRALVDNQHRKKLDRRSQELRCPAAATRRQDSINDHVKPT